MFKRFKLFVCLAAFCAFVLWYSHCNISQNNNNNMVYNKTNNYLWKDDLSALTSLGFFPISVIISSYSLISKFYINFTILTCVRVPAWQIFEQLHLYPIWDSYLLFLNGANFLLFMSRFLLAWSSVQLNFALCSHNFQVYHLQVQFTLAL